MGGEVVEARMTERITLWERYWNARHLVEVWAAGWSFWCALGRRRRNSLRVYWAGLDEIEQRLWLSSMARAANHCWHRARRRAAVLRAFSAGRITKDHAAQDLGLRDYADLLPTLGDAGLPLPTLPEDELRSMTENFLRVWKPEKEYNR